MRRFLPPWTLLPAALICLAVAWVYRSTLGFGWLWDDAVTVVDNPLLRNGAGLGRIWAGSGTPDYFPLTATVQWVLWHLGGVQPAGYHAANVGLHLIAAFLFWRVLAKLGVGPAWVGGLLMAVHPVMVESVAWVSELKNTLSLPLLLGAFLFYLESGEGSRPAYGAALLCYLAALLCKTSVVMFPGVLLLYAWWRRGRIDRRDLRSSAPFFALSLALGLVTVWFQDQRGMQAGILPLGGLASRLATAGLTTGFYLSKTVFPTGLRPVYPRWPVDPPGWVQLLPLLSLGAAAGWLLIRPGPVRRTVLFGLGFFLLNLLPVIGLVPVAYFHISWVADHFAYLPLLGVFGLAAAAIGRWLPPAAGRAVALALATLLASASRGYSRHFQNEETLWAYVLRQDPGSWVAHNNLGKTLIKAGRPEEGIPQLEEALRVGPPFAAADIDLNLGFALALAGRPFEAIRRTEEATRLRPNDAEAHSNLGNLLSQTGQVADAIDQYRQAVRLNPNSAGVHNNLGIALTREGRTAEAILECAEAVRLEPGYLDARYNWAVALGHAGRNAEALAQFRQVLEQAPDRADAHNNLGIVLAGLGRVAEAQAEFEAALRLKPDFLQAAQNLARSRRAQAAPP